MVGEFSIIIVGYFLDYHKQHNHFIPVCILRSKKNAVDMTPLWILMDNSSSYPQTP